MFIAFGAPRYSRSSGAACALTSIALRPERLISFISSYKDFAPPEQKTEP